MGVPAVATDTMQCYEAASLTQFADIPSIRLYRILSDGDGEALTTFVEEETIVRLTQRRLRSMDTRQINRIVDSGDSPRERERVKKHFVGIST